MFSILLQIHLYTLRKSHVILTMSNHKCSLYRFKGILIDLPGLIVFTILFCKQLILIVFFFLLQLIYANFTKLHTFKKRFDPSSYKSTWMFISKMVVKRQNNNIYFADPPLGRLADFGNEGVSSKLPFLSVNASW